jgi:hypothetical protein
MSKIGDCLGRRGWTAFYASLAALPDDVKSLIEEKVRPAAEPWSEEEARKQFRMMTQSHIDAESHRRFMREVAALRDASHRSFMRELVALHDACIRSVISVFDVVSETNRLLHSKYAYLIERERIAESSVLARMEAWAAHTVRAKAQLELATKRR